MDEELAAAILKASRHSMGMDASPVDMSNIVTFCERMVKLAEYRRDLYAYLVDKVRHVPRAACDILNSTGDEGMIFRVPCVAIRA